MRLPPGGGADGEAKRGKRLADLLQSRHRSDLFSIRDARAAECGLAANPAPRYPAQTNENGANLC